MSFTVSMGVTTAHADCISQTAAITAQGSFEVSAQVVCTGEIPAAVADDAQLVEAPIPEQTTCLSAVGLLNAGADGFCSSDALAAPALSSAMVSEAFRRIPLPASTLQVQPPGGETLVNFETNFYTHRAAFTRHVNLLGRHVTLRIRPSSFGWHFGDDVSATTSTPGAPYPDLDVTHSYTAAEPVSPRVDTTYTADWRLPAGPWQSVPGTVTITGATVALDVREARPILVNHE